MFNTDTLKTLSSLTTFTAPASAHVPALKNMHVTYDPIIGTLDVLATDRYIAIHASWVGLTDEHPQFEGVVSAAHIKSMLAVAKSGGSLPFARSDTDGQFPIGVQKLIGDMSAKPDRSDGGARINANMLAKLGKVVVPAARNGVPWDIRLVDSANTGAMIVQYETDNLAMRAALVGMRQAK